MHQIAREEYEKTLLILSKDIYRLERILLQAKKILEPKELEKPRERIDTTRRK